MTRFTQKYTLVKFFDPIEEGCEFPSSNWPLHSTIIDTFAIDWVADEMAANLADVLASYSVVNSEAKDDQYFGEDGQVCVTLLDRTDSLVNLHRNVLAVLESGGLVLNDPQFAYDGFLPHATVQKSGRLNKGDAIQLAALSIVDMFPDEDPYKRKVLKTIKLRQIH